MATSFRRKKHQNESASKAWAEKTHTGHKPSLWVPTTQNSLLLGSAAQENALDECWHTTKIIAALGHRRRWASTKKMLMTSLWAQESRKQRKHNMRTHCLKSAAAAPQKQTKSLKNQSFSLKRKQKQTQRNTKTKKDARKTLEKRPHARTAPKRPSWGAPKPSGGSRLTGVSTGQGGCTHGAKRPHLRIIVLYKYNI